MRRKIRYKCLSIILAIFFLSMCEIKILNKKIMPRLLEIAKIEAEKVGINYLNNAIENNIVNSLKIDDLFIITYNNNNEIVSIDYNTIIVNDILTKINKQIDSNLTLKNNNGIYIYVPFSFAFFNTYLGNLGPKIPVKLEYIGNVISSIKPKVNNYGINNALIEIELNLSINVRVIMPFLSDNVLINTSIPLSIKVLNGKVPEYYLSGFLGNPASN